MGSEDTKIVLIFVSSATVIVLMAVLVALFVALYQKRITSQAIRLQQMENDFQQELLLATISGQERERKRLAKDLHDSIGSLLSGLNLNLKQQLRLHTGNEQQQTFLQEACGMLEDGIVDVRRISHNLMPVVLESFGLTRALEEWIDPIKRNNALTIDLKIENQASRLLPALELGLFRVVQELLQNTIRHANASHVCIELHFKENSLELVYTDNGIGLSSGEYQLGIGIKNIQSRIHALKGSFELNKESVSGFLAQISVPLNHNT